MTSTTISAGSTRGLAGLSTRALRRVSIAVLAVLLSLVSLVAGTLRPAPASAATPASVTWASDWAVSAFCGQHGGPYMGATFDGVAACGNAYPNNYQGYISYNGVELDSVGFQCYELAARYFYYLTGHKPPVQPYASDLAWFIHADYGYPVAPAGATGGTDTYSSSLHTGDILSMWDSSDEVGHVGVVLSVNLNSSNTGKIWILDENASGSGVDTMTVTDGRMSIFGYNEYQWVSGLPAAPTNSAQNAFRYNMSSGDNATLLQEYQGPGSTFAVEGRLGAGASIEINCQFPGSTVDGSRIWDRLTNGLWVSDDGTTTPTFNNISAPLQECPSAIKPIG